MKKIVLVTVFNAMLSVGYATAETGGGKEISVNEQFDQLKAVNDSRHELLEQLDDKELAQLLGREQHSNYFTMLNLIPFYMKPGEFQYTQPQLLHFHDYNNAAEMTAAYLQSLVAVNSHDHPFCMRHSNYQGFFLREGFEFPFRHRLTYGEMVLDNGDALQIPDVANLEKETDDIIYSGSSYCYNGSLDGAQPVTVNGEFHAQLPYDLLEFEFTAADVGETVEQDGYLVTLLEFTQGRYAIEINAAEGNSLEFGNQDVLAEAVDEFGQYIDWRGTERVPTNRAQRIDDLLEELIADAVQGTIDVDTARSELLALKESFDEEQGERLYLSRAFNGIADKALVTLMLYSDEDEIVSHELDLPVHNFPSRQGASEANLNALPQIPVTAPVYDGRAALRTSIVELDEELMQERIRTVQMEGGSDLADTEEEFTGYVVWFYPPVQNDIFLDREDHGGTLHVLAKLEFYDEQGELVEGHDVRTAQEEDEIAYEFQTQGVAFPYPFMTARLAYNPNLFSDKPTRIKGTLPMWVAPDLIKDSYSPDDLPDGMTLNGNQLIIDYAVFEPREVAEVKDESIERRNQVFVKDSHGYLSEIKKETLYHSGAERTAVDVYYFYGEPKTIEVWYRGATTLTDYVIDIPLVSDGYRAQ